MCPCSRARAQAVLGVLAASAGAWLGELGREWKGWRSSAGAQHCGNHTVIYPVQKSVGCRVYGSKTLPNSCSNYVLLSPGQKGALPAGLSSLSWREGAKGAFQVKFPILPARTGWEHTISQSQQSHFAEIWRKLQTDGWIL